MAEVKYKYIVKKEFRDINNFDLVHKAKSDVSNMDHERLEELIKNGMVSKVEIK